MKKSIYLFILCVTVGLVSCKKDKNNQTIKQYDEAQIQAYIANNHLTGMKRDTVGGDTSGIYYQVLSQGTGDAVDYSTPIAFVYTIQSLDGKYAVTDTISNHSYNYLGHLTPPGLMLALHNAVKRKGTKVHILIPSRLAYGQNGSGTGGSRLPGNESLDYYVNVIEDKQQANYDDISIQKYIAANNLSGFQPYKTTSGDVMYYKIRKAGTGTSQIVSTSIVQFDYNSHYLNNTYWYPTTYSATAPAAQETYQADATVSGLPVGFVQGLLLARVAGTDISIILPSRLGYGLTGNSTYSVPAFSCLYYDMTIDTVTN